MNEAVVDVALLFAEPFGAGKGDVLGVALADAADGRGVLDICQGFGAPRHSGSELLQPLVVLGHQEHGRFVSAEFEGFVAVFEGCFVVLPPVVAHGEVVADGLGRLSVGQVLFEEGYGLRDVRALLAEDDGQTDAGGPQGLGVGMIAALHGVNGLAVIALGFGQAIHVPAGLAQFGQYKGALPLFAQEGRIEGEGVQEGSLVDIQLARDEGDGGPQGWMIRPGPGQDGLEGGEFVIVLTHEKVGPTAEGQIGKCVGQNSGLPGGIGKAHKSAGGPGPVGRQESGAGCGGLYGRIFREMVCLAVKTDGQ